MRVRVHGARGSVPTSGPAVRRYGGETTCLEVEFAPGHRLLLDCGSGLRSVAGPESAFAAGRRFDVLLTHYHWDHLVGLPLFAPLYDATSTFAFHGQRWQGGGVREALEGVLREPWVPVSLARAPAGRHYRDLDDRPLRIGGVRVSYAALHHPQGAVAYRLEQDGRALVFATDHERGDPAADLRLRELARGASVLVHDAQYTPEEYETGHRGWGHSTWEHAVRAAEEAGVDRLVLFHHDPRRSDEALDRIVRRAAERFPAVVAATEGMTLET